MPIDVFNRLAPGIAAAERARLVAGDAPVPLELN